VKRVVALALAALLVFVIQVCPAEAKARLIAVFPLRSTSDLAVAAKQSTQALAEQLGSIQGFDAKVLAPPTAGSLGVAAASAGAEFYVVGQLLKADGGYKMVAGSFEAATDKSISDVQVMLTSPSTIPAQAQIATLIPTAQTPSTGAVSGADGVEVSAGVPIVIELDAPLSSGSAKVGDTFSFHAVDDVVSDGWIVVPKGSGGQGEIVSAEGAGSNGHAGKMALQYDWIVSADGSKIKMSVSPQSSEGEGKGGAASTATIASYLLLGPLGLFAHNFVKGKDATIETTTKLKAYVEHTVHVKATQKAEQTSEFSR
jgi:hypothetical protein